MCAKVCDMNTYNISEFADIVGVSVKTLQRWDRESKLVPDRTPTNRRVYTDAHVAIASGKTIHMDRKVVVYARVSSQAQKPDLENQVVMLEQFCAANGYPVDEWVKEIGGGLNFKRKKFTKLIDEIVSGSIEKVVIAHRDRLARFGFDLLQHLCDTHNCELVVMNTESLSPEQEMIQDMLSIVHCFSARLYGLRNYKKALKEALSGDTSTQDASQPDA